MAGLNKVQIIGRVGRDPEFKEFSNGGRLASFSLAVSETWKDKNSGERKEKTEWVQISCTNTGLVGVIERFVKKGSQIYVEGKLETRKWQDKDGNDRYTTEVVLRPFSGELILLDSAKRQEQPEAGTTYSYDPKSGTQEMYAPPKDDLEDDIPF